MELTFNGTSLSIAFVEDLGRVPEQFDQEQQFELWVSAPNGRSLAMLRNGGQAWLMYLLFNGDSGVVTKGDKDEQGSCAYKLAEGEVNEIPRSWCVDLDQCYKAVANFFANDGARYDHIAWQTA